MNAEQSDLQVNEYRDIVKKVLSGAGFRVSSYIIVRIITIVKLIIFARLFLPSDIGIANLVVSIVTIVSLISDLGFGQSVIREQSNSRDFINTAFILAIISGLAVFIVLFIISPLLTRLFSANITDYIRLLAIITFSVPIHFPNYLWEKELQYFHPSVVLVVIELSSFIVTISVQLFFHLGVMSLLVGTLAGFLISFIYNWSFSKYRPAFIIDKTQKNKMLSFGFPFMIQGMNGIAMSKGDNLMVGAYAGMEQLGYYNYAWQLPTMIASFAQTIESTLYPVYAKINQNRSAVNKLFNISNKLWSIVGSFFGFGIIAFAESIVNVLFGSQWEPVVPILKVMTLSFIIRYCTGYAYGNLAIVRGRTKYLMKWGIVSTIFIFTVGQFMIMKYGSMGGAWFWIIQAIIFIPLQRFPLIYQELHSLEVLRHVWQPIAAGLISFISATLIIYQLPGVIYSILALIIYIITYALCLFIIDKEFVLVIKKIQLLISKD